MFAALLRPGPAWTLLEPTSLFYFLTPHTGTWKVLNVLKLNSAVCYSLLCT